MATRDIDRFDAVRRSWVTEAIRQIDIDAHRSVDTHLRIFPLPPAWGIELYLKDESVHPTGSLKHRLARSLFLYALCNGWVHEGTTIVEASSGSTAVSEAYFARLLGLPFVAVVPTGTSQEKLDQIRLYGGACYLVDDPATILDVSRRLADERDGHFMDQFTYAERATDWRGNNNIAETIFEQLAREPNPIPRWIVVGAGTGGTSATIGRYIRYRQLQTGLCVVDPERSAFFPAWEHADADRRTVCGSHIEGIGRPRMEPSFIPTIVDRMIEVSDAASIAAMRMLHRVTGLQAGGSTGTNIWGAFRLAAEMLERGERGCIVTLICDTGSRYLDTYYADAWLEANGLDLRWYQEALETFLATGAWTAPAGSGEDSRQDVPAGGGGVAQP
ncbi:MAG: PLP-dependent cysteine synthase family protein [Chloroflexi bacterium]|nr:PLP-dependent cysteine synthase family protein [Chloroflexota bacterium]